MADGARVERPGRTGFTQLSRERAMSPRVTGALVIAFGMLASTTAGAQTAQSFVDPANGLSLDQAIAQALAQEPSLRAAKTTVDAARGMRTQAGLKPNLSTSAEFR